MKYHIIGGDGDEYGPVPDETIREWIADHRLDAHSKIKPEGADAWSSLGELPEFSVALAAPLPPQSAPQGTVDIAVCVSSAFEIFGKHWPRLVIGCLLWLLAILLVFVVSTLLNTPASTAFQSLAQHESVDAATWARVGPLYAAGMLFSTVANALLWAGALRFLLNIVRGAEPDFQDIFSGFQRRQVPIMLTGIAQTLLTLLGVLLCIAPGIYLAVSYMFAAPIALERNLGVWESLELARRTVARSWWQLFALALIGIVLSIAGAALCLVGVLAAYPIAGLMLARAYHDLFDHPAPESPGRTPAS
jgi:hypothetical protein